MRQETPSAALTLFDIEGNGFLEEITKCWLIVSLELQQNHTSTPRAENFSEDLEVFPPDLLQEGIQHLQNSQVLVGHNVIDYDLPALWKVHGKWDHVPLILDTLIISRYLWPERPWGHSLEGWGEHLGNKKGEFSAFDEYSEEMLEYCKQDVIVNYHVFKALEKEYGQQFMTGFKVY